MKHPHPQTVDPIDTLAPTLNHLYGPQELTNDFTRTLVSFGTLPSWPGGPQTGHGLGDLFNRSLGGGMCPGYMIAIGAAHAGAGKTAFVMQLADGLALRTSEMIRDGQKQPITSCSQN